MIARVFEMRAYLYAALLSLDGGACFVGIRSFFADARDFIFSFPGVIVLSEGESYE